MHDLWRAFDAVVPVQRRGATEAITLSEVRADGECLFDGPPAALHAQGQQGPPPAGPAERAQVAPAQPTFRVNIDLITTDMIPRDSKSEQFLADLKPHEIEIYEDGVKQQIVSLTLNAPGSIAAGASGDVTVTATTAGGARWPLMRR